MRMKLAWIVNTHPDLQFEISKLDEVTDRRLSEGKRMHIQRLNAVIRYLHKNVAYRKTSKAHWFQWRSIRQESWLNISVYKVYSSDGFFESRSANLFWNLQDLNSKFRQLIWPEIWNRRSLKSRGFYAPDERFEIIILHHKQWFSHVRKARYARHLFREANIPIGRSFQYQFCSLVR